MGWMSRAETYFGVVQNTLEVKIKLIIMEGLTINCLNILRETDDVNWWKLSALIAMFGERRFENPYMRN